MPSVRTVLFGTIINDEAKLSRIGDLRKPQWIELRLRAVLTEGDAKVLFHRDESDRIV
jgi:hypothetical protein